MANQWLRLWHDLPNDPKWRTIARVSKQSIGNVIAVYMHVLVDASANENERGRTQSVCIEDVATALDINNEQVEAIIAAMQGRVLEGDKVSGWAKRQPAREDGSAERAKAWREKKKGQSEQDRTQANAPERQEEIREDKEKDKTYSPEPGLPGIDDPLPTDPEKPSRPACPHQQIIDLYHKHLPTGTEVRVWNETRKKALQARWREDEKRQNLEWWSRFFGYLAKSDFLTGQTNPSPGRDPFVVSLDWLVNPTNFAKAVEGKYHRSAV